MAYDEGPGETWNFDLPELWKCPQLPESSEPPSSLKEEETIVRILCLSVFVILGIVPGALCMLGKHSATGLCPPCLQWVLN